MADDSVAAFTLLNVLLDAMLTDIAARMTETFAQAAGILPEELPRNAEFGPADEGVVSQAVRASLNRAGLETVAHSMLTQFTSAISRFASAPNFHIPGDTLDQLAGMVTSTSRRVTELGIRTDADVQRILALAVRQPLTAVQLADELRASLKTEGQYARTIVETEMKAAQRLLAVNVGAANGYTRFGYLGPEDIFTRVFCDHMVGWWFTIPMLEECDNGQLPDVVLTLGGYNCRHGLAPATENMVRRTFPGKLVIDWNPVEIMDGKTPITVIEVTASE